jgi:hypothetical protein
VWIQVGAAEKINTGNFSNVDVGPILYGKWIEDKGEEENYKVVQQLQQEFVEAMVAEERMAVIESLKS